MLALTGDARRWEPKKLRLRLFSAAALLISTGRRRWLRFNHIWPWSDVITAPNFPAPRLTSGLTRPDDLINLPESGTRRPPDATAGTSP